MAATAYDEAALQLRGQGMQLNFPELKGFVASHIDESHWTHQSWWVLLPGKVEDSGELNVFPSETRPGNSFTHMMVGSEGNPDRICSTRLKKKRGQVTAEMALNSIPLMNMPSVVQQPMSV